MYDPGKLCPCLPYREDSHGFCKTRGSAVPRNYKQSIFPLLYRIIHNLATSGISTRWTCQHSAEDGMETGVKHVGPALMEWRRLSNISSQVDSKWWVVSNYDRIDTTYVDVGIYCMQMLLALYLRTCPDVRIIITKREMLTFYVSAHNGLISFYCEPKRVKSHSNLSPLHKKVKRFSLNLKFACHALSWLAKVYLSHYWFSCCSLACFGVSSWWM